MYLWNYHLPALKKRLDSALLPDLLTGFESALSVLKVSKRADVPTRIAPASLVRDIVVPLSVWASRR